MRATTVLQHGRPDKKAYAISTWPGRVGSLIAEPPSPDQARPRQVR